MKNIELILCTCPTEKDAKNIAHALVEAQLAACINLLPNVTSVYRWQGEVVSDDEIQLLIKTCADNFVKISEVIKSLHPYDVPEIISLNIQQADKQYSHWIMDSIK